MALFDVEGWDIKTKNIAFDNKTKKSKERKKNKNRKTDKLTREQKLKEETEAELKEQVEDISPEELVADKTPKKVEKSGREETNNKKRKHDESSAPEQRKAKVEQPTRKQLTPLQQKMMAKLTGSRFRWINEQLYTISSEEALKLVKEQPQLFDEYHDGFRSQVQTWPENPVDVFVDQIRFRCMKPVNAPGGLPGLKDSKEIVVADMGCGEAQLALEINNFFKSYNKKAKKSLKRRHKVHSFDLKKANERITVADIRNVPLPDESCTIVVFCLALMGTNFLDFIKEAYRILAPRGELWIAEIKSRFGDGRGNEFVDALKLMGFFHKRTFDENKMFTRFEFFKPPGEIIEERRQKLERRQKFVEVETEKEELEKKRKKIAEGKWLLKPCIYKRR
ncbi:RRP8-like protein [Saccharomyces kudriavzevii IFO 1802]|uniref:Ribosomal RNA-processing protein 8 n=1 Tax=Saccharomyces kudriavzevii (strain ATCC MYA-4449 / AS 2.2408 / CBS 8840 / NBRC 1802 / NCYC 2889) TaxID=226230 RepID=J5RFU3_SACK1|nr:RRP8-like protein [Saccharomyces kudriavzevii IFO 1802]